MAADRSRLAAALAYEEERRRRMMESVPGLVTTPAQPAPRADFRTNLENLSIGLGEGLTNQLEGIKGIITDPVGTAKGVYEAGRAVIRDPSVIADALRYTAQKATSGPLGAGEVIGEMISPTRGGVGKRDIFIGKSAKTYDPAAEQRAIEMEKAGVDRDTIWRETGTGRVFGPDWKQEISDLSAEYRPGAAFAEATEKAKLAGDLYDDALFLRNYANAAGMYGVKTTQEADALIRNAEKWFTKTFGRKPAKDAMNVAKNQTADEIQGKLTAIENLTPQRQSFATNIGSVLQHEELKKAYPEIGNERVRMASPSVLGLGVEGSYSPWEGEIKLRDDIGFQLERGKNVLLHELQHAVQQREGFARGGTTDVARQVLNEQFDKEMQPFQSALNKRVEAISKSSIASKAQYAQKLKELQQKQNIKPRELTRLSDWYQYGTRVSQELDDIGLGWQMPREKGAARDKWIQKAVKIMQRMMEEKDPAMRGIENAITPSQAKSLVRKTNKVLSETQDDVVKAAKVQEKYRELNAKSDFDLYQRLAGEAEARAVQKRMNLTPTERRQNPPWQSLDVPEQEFIFRR
jgi:hypothetical protein